MAEDSQGNVTGIRKAFVYTTDFGVSYNALLDNSVSVAAGNVASTNGALPVLCPSKYIQPRYLNVQAKTDPAIRKRITIGDPANALFASNAASEFTINGVVFVVTGRVGEVRSTLLVDDPPP